MYTIFLRSGKWCLNGLQPSFKCRYSVPISSRICTRNRCYGYSFLTVNMAIFGPFSSCLVPQRRYAFYGPLLGFCKLICRWWTSILMACLRSFLAHSLALYTIEPARLPDTKKERRSAPIVNILEWIVKHLSNGPFYYGSKCIVNVR